MSGRRFIPTCVGNCNIGGAIAGGSAVHPHVCGELLVPVVDSDGIIGSSPRVWGTDTIGGKCARNERFIPTCVGNCNIHPLQLL